MSGSLVHLVRPARPSPGRPPLVLLFHGVGSQEGDLFSLADSFDPRAVVVSVRAPLTLRPGSYAWFPVQFTPEGPVADTVEAERSLGILADFVAWAVEEYQADPGRVAAVGFSQGAIMASGLALLGPRNVRAAVMMSGRTLPEFAARAAGPHERTGQRWLVVHGTQDNVLPVAHGRATRQTLADLGIDAEYREFPMGHTITEDSLTLVTTWVTRVLD
jgi:phospholipase/carboxylesterase